LLQAEEAVMDFIEQLFGFSPDGGSGSFELLLILAPFLVAAVWFYMRRQRR
jgi:hypothetical protein